MYKIGKQKLIIFKLDSIQFSRKYSSEIIFQKNTQTIHSQSYFIVLKPVGQISETGYLTVSKPGDFLQV